MKKNQADATGAPKKKSHKLLTIIAVVVVLAAVGGAMGCNGGSNATSASGGGDASSSASASAPAAEPQKADHEYAVVGVSAATDFAGNPVALVTYTFTNNTEETADLTTDFKAEVYQNGVECQETFGVDGTDSLANLSKVKGGATAQFTLAYQVKDGSEVEVDVMDSWLGDSDKPVVSQTFPLA